MIASLRAYLPKDTHVHVFLTGETSTFDHIGPLRISIFYNEGSTFGESYNNAVRQVFDEGYDSVIIANDDIVVTPMTWPKLLEDIDTLKHTNVGWLAARSDWARGWQNIRHRNNEEQLDLLRWPSENTIVPVPVIAPIFAWIRKEAWIDFPPLNWYSDDIQCHDISKNGFQHYIGRFYVHHVGAQTCGLDWMQLNADAKEWIKAYRPDIYVD